MHASTTHVLGRVLINAQIASFYFKEDWLIPILDLPPRSALNVYGASDYAVTSDGGDHTVHVVIGIDQKRRCFCSTSGDSRPRPMCGSRRTVHPRPHGAGRLVRARSRAMATGPESRVALYPRPVEPPLSLKVL